MRLETPAEVRRVLREGEGSKRGGEGFRCTLGGRELTSIREVVVEAFTWADGTIARIPRNVTYTQDLTPPED